MTQTPWSGRCAAILAAASDEGFAMDRFVRSEIVSDPHGSHVGRRIVAIVPARSADLRVDDVAVPVARGDWSAPTELCEASSVARRSILSLIFSHAGDVISQTAILTAAFVHSHVTMRNRRRYAWPIDRSAELVRTASAHLAGNGTAIPLPASETFALLSSVHMCRSAPEGLCDDDRRLDRSVGRHLALSFRKSTLLEIEIRAGGTAIAPPPPADMKAFLALERGDLERMLVADGLAGICARYGMKQRDVQMGCRKRGIDAARIAA